MLFQGRKKPSKCAEKKSKGVVILVKKLCEINPDILVVSLKKTPHIWRRDSVTKKFQELNFLGSYDPGVLDKFLAFSKPNLVSEETWMPQTFIGIKKNNSNKNLIKNHKNIIKCTTGSTLCWQADCNFWCQSLTFCMFCHRK